MPFGGRMTRLGQVRSPWASRPARALRADARTAKPVWALVLPWEPWDGGGVNQVVLNLAAELRSQGRYEPVVIVLDWRKTGVETHDGVRHLFARLREPRWTGLGLLGDLRSDFLAWREARQFRRLLRRLGASIVNFHYPGPAAEHLLRAPDRRRYRILFSLHGTDINEAVRRGPAYRARYLAMLRDGDGIVVVSEGFAAQVARELAPELADRLTVIYNGVAPERLRPAPRSGIALPARYILNVATFETKKGQTHLVDAFAKLAAADPDLHLVIAGRPESALPALIEQIERLGLGERVLLLRDVPHAEVGALFAGARLFCLSSLAEPFGIVLLEAGLFGLPVVATRVGGVPEIVRDGDNGILVEPGDSAALAAAIGRLLANQDMAARLGARLRARVLDEFQWPALVERYVALAETPR